MPNKLLIVGLLSVCACPADAATPTDSVRVLTWTFGVGRQSCGTWTPDLDQQVQIWIYGYWSGLNTFNQNNHRLVGSTTDGPGIVAAIRKECAEDPTESIGDVTLKVYSNLEAQKR